ncbi:MAG: ABC transporter permease [Bacteroidota bacterium]|nr:ABC transporter permease [Bacteroidota bacterium]
MRNWLTIVGREYKTRVRRRVFILSTLLGPVMMVGFIALIVLLTKSQESNSKILVVDSNEILSFYVEDIGQIPSCFECFPEREFLEYRFTTEGLSTEEFLESDYDGILEFDDGILQNSKALLQYETTPSMRVKAAVKRDLTEAVERLRVKQESSLDYETYKRLKVKIGLVTQDVETRDRNAESKTIVGWIFSMFMFMFIMIYGMHVMRGVIEEKSNRIVEVVVSIVKPEALMAAKVVGIGLVGLTQILAWALLSWFLFLGFGTYAESTGMLTEVMAESGNAVATTDLNTFMSSHEDLGFLMQINWLSMIGWGLFFYLGGFALYGSLFAAVGSSVEQESDTQYLLLPVMIPLIFSYMLNIQILESPETTLATVCSYFPFTSPITMMVRLSMGVPWWEIVLSALILILTVYLMIKLAGRIYRTGIFMYGKKPSLLEMFKWLTYKNR